MLYISHGSLSETEYYLLLARDLKYLSEEVGRMLNGLVKSLLGGVKGVRCEKIANWLLKPET